MSKGTSSIAKDWFTKLMLVLVALAVGSSIGVPARIFNQRGSAVAIVGNEKITAGDFMRRAQREMLMFKEKMGIDLPASSYVAFGRYTKLMDKMINEQLLALEANQLGFVVNEKQLTDEIREDPTFSDETGSFSRKRFKYYLRQIGITEKDFKKKFYNQVQKLLLENSIVRPIAATDLRNFSTPLFTKLWQKHDIEIASFKWENEKVDSPKEDELNDFYEQNKTNYILPELRDFNVIHLDFAKFKKNIKISDKELLAHYEGNDFSVPEKRGVRTLLIATKETADKAYEAFRSGASFGKVATEIVGLTPDEFPPVAEVTYDQLIPQLAGDIFRVREKHNATKPRRLKNRYVIAYVTHIKQKKERSFNEVKEEIRNTLVTDAAKEKIMEEVEAIEQKIKRGVGLDMIAEDLSLKVESYNKTSIQGVGYKQEAKPKLAVYKEALPKVFELPEGMPSEPLRLRDNSYIIADVTKVRPSKQLELDDIEEELKKELITEKKRLKTKRKLKELKANLVKKGTLAAEALKSKGDYNVIKRIGLQDRDHPDIQNAELGRTVVAAIDDTDHDFVIVHGHDKSYIAKVKRTYPLDLYEESDELKKVATSVQSQVAEDLMNAYLETLKTRHPVEVNESFQEVFLKHFK